MSLNTSIEGCVMKKNPRLVYLAIFIRVSTKYVRQVNLTEINLWMVGIVYRSSIQTEDFYFIFWSVNAYSNLLFELN